MDAAATLSRFLTKAVGPSVPQGCLRGSPGLCCSGSTPSMVTDRGSGREGETNMMLREGPQTVQSMNGAAGAGKPPTPPPAPPTPPHLYFLKSDCVLLLVHPTNGCVQERGTSDCAITCSVTLARSFYSWVSCFEDKKRLGTPSKKLCVLFFQKN